MAFITEQVTTSNVNIKYFEEALRQAERVVFEASRKSGMTNPPRPTVFRSTKDVKRWEQEIVNDLG